MLVYVAKRDRLHARAALRQDFDEARMLQPGQSGRYGKTRYPHALADGYLVYHHAGFERQRDDGIAQRLLDGVRQAAPLTTADLVQCIIWTTTDDRIGWRVHGALDFR